MNQAENLMKSLVDQSQTIEYVAENFVSRFPEFVYELSKVIDRCFNKCSMDRKGTCIELICLILKKSVQKNCQHTFVKGLAQRLRFFLQDLSRNYVSEGVALNVGRNVESLKFTGIFCDQYFEKLQQLTKRIKDNISLGNAGQFNNSASFDLEQKNYTRTFLIEYNDISQNQELKAIYDTFVEYSKLENELNQAKGNTNQMDEVSLKFSDNLNVSAKSKNSSIAGNSDLNLQSTDHRRAKLQQIIMQYHTHILNLQNSMKEETNKFEENFCQNIMNDNRLESQRNFLVRIDSITQ